MRKKAQHRLTADKKASPKLPPAASFIRKTLNEIARKSINELKIIKPQLKGGQNMANDRKLSDSVNLLWKEEVDKRLSSREEIKALRASISLILSKIDEINKT